MKTLLLLGAWAVLSLSQGKAAEPQNQHEINQQAGRDFETADAALNKVYQQVLRKLDPEAQVKIKAVQRAWIQFRDAEAAFQADQEARDGSMAPLIYEGTRSQLTKARTSELQTLLKGL